MTKEDIKLQDCTIAQLKELKKIFLDDKEYLKEINLALLDKVFSI